MIGLIVAFSKNRVIGINNQLPWNIPNDLKYFKKETMGKTIVMGRNTFESIGKPLPGRKNIVVTSNKDWSFDGVETIDSIEKIRDYQEDIMIIGGAKLYEQTIHLVDRLYITKIEHEFEGDAFFPELDLNEWVKIRKEKGEKNDKNPYDYFFEIYERGKMLK